MLCYFTFKVSEKYRKECHPTSPHQRKWSQYSHCKYTDHHAKPSQAKPNQAKPSQTTDYRISYFWNNILISDNNAFCCKTVMIVFICHH